MHCFRHLAFITSCLLFTFFSATASGADLKLLFLGDNGHHRPESRFEQLASALDSRGIQLKYTDQMSSLTLKNLNQFDGLVLYANIDHIDDTQAKVVLDYVSSGKGFIPLHCATFCWRNSQEMINLMGAQFQRHGGKIFTTQIAEPSHPIMKNYGSFSSWDETYIHHQHNEKNRTVLEYRVEGDQAEGNDREPWTWVRTHGKGRVFYTAWGHDERTFGNPGFQNLVERGIRWACGGDPSVVPAHINSESFQPPEMTTLRTDVADFKYVDVGPKIPNYTPGEKWGVQGKLKTLMQKPLPPEESIKHFVTPQSMNVRLYADERSFKAKPIAMTWDERGRLWICETLDYPNELGGNRDRIRICEDTDGDHVADKFTVFAEGLSIPTAIVIVRGGAVVQNGTETIYLKDTTGDDVADEKTTLLTGWALGDTHGGVSNFRYGLDNWIWAMQGYNNSTPQIDGKTTQSFRMGFWRFKLSQSDPPQVTDLEFIRSSNNNTWGLGISEDGLIFGSTANHNPSMFMPIANRYYERVRGWSPKRLETIADTYKFKPITDKIRQVDQFGGYTAAAGHSLYTARAFPQQWWNKTAFVCGPTGHLVGTFVLRNDGADYTSTSPVNLLSSDDEWSAPIMAEVGPDGAVWVIDWYNYIVQHNPTPQGFETGKGNAYESDLRDKKHGRIYRVVPEDEDALHDYSSLEKASSKELVQALKHPSMQWRLHAQRLLIEQKPQDIFKELLFLLTDDSIDSVGLNVGAIHALHTLKGLGYLNFDLELKSASMLRSTYPLALTHPSAGVRRNALAVLPRSNEGLAILFEYETLFTDSDAQVQLQAVLTLSDMPVSDQAGELIRYLELKTQDPVLSDALTSAAATHATSYLAAVGSSESPSNKLQIAQRVAEHIARGRPNAKELQPIVASLGKMAPQAANVILDGLTAGLPRDFNFATNNEFDAALVAAVKNGSSASQSKLIRLAMLCRTKALDNYSREIVEALVKTISDDEQSDTNRVTAARDLIGFRPDDADVAEQVIEQITSQTNPELAVQFLQITRLSTSDSVGELILARMRSLTPQLKAAMISTLLSRPIWTKQMLTGIEEGKVDLGELSLDQKQALQAFPDKEIRNYAMSIFAKGGSLPDANRDKVLKSLLSLCDEEGDVSAGRKMFEKHCSKCHKHGDLGKSIGPNLTGMAVHPKSELLMHIIDPSRSVEGNFRSYTVMRTDGRIATGMLAAETKTSISLIDVEGKETSIQREDIEELLASRKSVMPEGFEKQMTPDELSDLLEFLTNKGKYVPILLDKYATAISTKGLFGNPPNDSGPDRMVFSDWSPKEFQGVPYLLTDPQGKSKPNIVLLNGPNAPIPQRMPKSVKLPCNMQAKTIHILGGVGGWNFPFDRKETVSLIVRLHYEDGSSEDHKLLNGVHIADYIRRVDVPESEFAFALGRQQLRHIALMPDQVKKITSIEFIKGIDNSAPIVMAVTIERE